MVTLTMVGYALVGLLHGSIVFCLLIYSIICLILIGLHEIAEAMSGDDPIPSNPIQSNPILSNPTIGLHEIAEAGVRWPPRVHCSRHATAAPPPRQAAAKPPRYRHRRATAACNRLVRPVWRRRHRPRHFQAAGLRLQPRRVLPHGRAPHLRQQARNRPPCYPATLPPPCFLMDERPTCGSRRETAAAPPSERPSCYPAAPCYPATLRSCCPATTLLFHRRPLTPLPCFPAALLQDARGPFQPAHPRPA